MLSERFYQYFSEDEFKHFDKMDVDFLNLLAEIRHDAGISFTINSDFRTPQENKAAGGTSSSAHLRGKAVDVACRNSENRFKIVKSAIKLGINRVGIAKTFVHLDNDNQNPQNVLWLY